MNDLRELAAPDLADLDADVLTVARDSAVVLLRFRAYMPPGGLLVMMLGRFRDDVREALGMESQRPVDRGREFHSLDELTSVEFDTLRGAVGILLDRFSGYMDDPALPGQLGDFREALGVQREERAALRKSIVPIAD